MAAADGIAGKGKGACLICDKRNRLGLARVNPVIDKNSEILKAESMNHIRAGEL
jgi:hypothetical protein